MIAKIGFVLLVLISSGTLFMLDYYLKQDQVENSKQLHSFVQQTRNAAKAMSTAKEKFQMELITDLAHCQEIAAKSNRDYLGLIVKAVPLKHGQPLPTAVLDEAAELLLSEKADCVITYDSRTNAGI
jgi:alpha-D-ribose 1-methylphosphonate 5-triphosphate synthase subunit PhnH